MRSLGFKSVRGPGRTKSFEPNFARYLKGRTSKKLWRCVRDHRTEKRKKKIINGNWFRLVYFKQAFQSLTLFYAENCPFNDLRKLNQKESMLHFPGLRGQDALLPTFWVLNLYLFVPFYSRSKKSGR